MFLTLDSKRRLTLPKDLVTAEPGDYFDATYDAEDDAIIFRKLPSKGDWLSVLRQCPVPMDDLPSRRGARPKKLGRLNGIRLSTQRLT